MCSIGLSRLFLGTHIRRYWRRSTEDTENHPEVLLEKAYMSFWWRYDKLTAWAVSQMLLRYPVRPKQRQLEHICAAELEVVFDACTHARMHIFVCSLQNCSCFPGGFRG